MPMKRGSTISENRQSLRLSAVDKKIIRSNTRCRCRCAVVSNAWPVGNARTCPTGLSFFLQSLTFAWQSVHWLLTRTGVREYSIWAQKTDGPATKAKAQSTVGRKSNPRWFALSCSLTPDKVSKPWQWRNRNAVKSSGGNSSQSAGMFCTDFHPRMESVRLNPSTGILLKKATQK